MTRSLSLAAVVALFCVAAGGSNAHGKSVDLAEWSLLPLHHDGRTMPLDTFANRAKEIICEKEKASVSLNLVEYAPAKADLKTTQFAPALPLFNGDGSSVRWSSPEILLSWLTEADKWEVVPFIYCPHEELRTALGLPVFNDRNERLKYVSPKQIAESEKLIAYQRDLDERQAEEGFKETELDTLVRNLLERYTLYRSLTFDPNQPLTLSPVMQSGSRTNFMRQLQEVISLARNDGGNKRSFVQMLQVLAEAPNEEMQSAAQGALVALDAAREIGVKMVQQQAEVAEGADLDETASPATLQDARDAVQRLHDVSAKLEEVLSREKDRLYEGAAADDTSVKSLGPIFRELKFKASELKRLANEMHLALYDERNGLFVVPALNAQALKKNRDTDNLAQPWLTLHTVLYGDELLTGYPPKKVEAVRTAWAALRNAYTGRTAANREQSLASAQHALSTSLRDLGESIEPKRKKLVEKELSAAEQDPAMLAYTAYPQPEQMAVEVKYNRLQPFMYSWIIMLLSLLCFCLAFGKLHKPMFWAGVAILMAAIAWTTYGFYLRVVITQWAPVTNMYETVVYVPFMIAVFASWFLLLPLIWPGVQDAWRLTAFPFSWEAAELTPQQLEKMPASLWLAGNLAMGVARLGLMAFVLWFLGIASYADGGRAILPLVYAPTGGASSSVFNSLLVWGVGLVFLLGCTWFLPRAILTAAASFVTAPWNLFTSGDFGKRLHETYDRQAFGIGGAATSAFFLCLASYAPVLDENFSPLQPVLRSNFWLTVHVLTIVASYAAGLLAWGLGMGALAMYTIGTYREPIVHAKLDKFGGGKIQPLPRRPPEECAMLAHYTYRAIQVAVLLLAAGTILGGLWADVSWGRFWGWDPKEVWALISLLVYLAILHGRFAGWFNNFGLACGAVIGMTMIVMSWYGVNFALPQIFGQPVGLHSYGSGAGGLPYVILFVVINLCALIPASIRYGIESRNPVQPTLVDDEPLAAEIVEPETRLEA